MLLPNDVAEFFARNQSAFGAGNLTDNHLPSPARVRQLVKNTMTVDYAIGLAYRAPAYSEYLAAFARETSESCSAADLPDDLRYTYAQHYAQLETATPDQLAAWVSAAAAETFDTVNVFVPKQCNLSCRGCYAGALPVATHPYDTTQQVDSYLDDTIDLVTQGRANGLKTVYTSGDGEPTIFPRFFDLLESFRDLGVQWLFFTAGLVFSSEANARQAWQDARVSLRGESRERIATRIDEYVDAGDPKPTARAYLDELHHFRDNVQLYHSVWSTSAKTNSELRRPATSDYDYVREIVRGVQVELPSSVVALRDSVFTGEHRGRMGIEMPVSDISIDSLPAMATFVHDHGLRSYFEPTILTGRNRLGDLMPAQPRQYKDVDSLLVRKSCGFRNVHQPTIKYGTTRAAGAGFHASPGMGVNLQDLDRMGIADNVRVSGRTLFGAVHAPLMAYANYVYVEGCKCNDFAAALSNDRAGLAATWTRISGSADTRGLSAADCVSRLRTLAMDHV